MNDKAINIIQQHLIYKSFFSVYQYQLQHTLFSGDWSETITREVTDRKPAVGALLYDPHLDTVVLIEQFRIGALTPGNHSSAWLTEIVAGLIDKDESPEAVIKREIQEEAGLVASEVIPITQYWSSPGGSNEYIHLYVAKVDATKADGIHGLVEEHEDIRVFSITAQQAFDNVATGKINNAMAIIALMWLQLNRDRLKQQWTAT